MLVLIALHTGRDNKTILLDFKKTSLILRKSGEIKKIWSVLGGQTEDFWDRGQKRWKPYAQQALFIHRESYK